MNYPLTDFPKGTYLDEYFKPAKAGQTARYRVENVQTDEGLLLGAAVPLKDGVRMVRNRIGQSVPEGA